MSGQNSPSDARRCGWCGDDPLYVCDHDEEWGVPVRDARALFERLMLEGMQTGLIRHRGKLEALIGNARACLALREPLPELVWCPRHQACNALGAAWGD